MSGDLSMMDDVGVKQAQDGQPIKIFAPLDDEALADAKSDRVLGEKMLRGYFERYRGEPQSIKVHTIEQKVIVPVLTPSGRTSTAWAEAVVMDLVYETQDGRLMVMDHKSYERSNWWATSKILMINKQPTAYWRALKAVMGRFPDGHVTNVLFKDAPKEPEVLKSGALSCAKNASVSAADYEAAWSKIDKSKLKPADIAKCEAHLSWLRTQPPKEFFTRVTTPRTKEQLAAFDEDDRELMREMKTARAIRNESWSTCPSCDFLPLCPNDTPEARENFSKRDGVDKRESEFRLIGIKKIGKRQVISHSRRESYLRCRMQHHFRYVEGLKPALRATYFDFGDCIHRALATWYGLATEVPSEISGQPPIMPLDFYPGRDDVAIAVFVNAFKDGFEKRFGVKFDHATAPAPIGF